MTYTGEIIDLLNFQLTMLGGTIEASQDTSIVSTLLHEANSEVNVASGKVLTYSGPALDIGALTLTLSGGGAAEVL